ncbi:MAG: hypothetical protein P8R42_06855 [Candidatus Binatia bacterium]|nr:hypothetical protein [Candidatus Binatia bacterium]
MKSKRLTTLVLATLLAICGDAGVGPTTVPSHVVREGEKIGLEEGEEEADDAAQRDLRPAG